ncbi:MAG: hypothetical protein QOH76_1448 [Thermoleophilaceae bacterium]|nr:hypothetical protein [Thermoleophilaceae bacterium]
MNLFLVGGPAQALRTVADQLPFFPGREVQSSGAVAWIAHSDDYVSPDGSALFSGRPIVWSGDSADGRAPLDPAFWLDPPVDALDGRYVGIRVVDGQVTVFADALGAYPVYQRGGMVSNNAEVLRDPSSSMRADVLASLLGGGWSLSGDPVWDGIERIQPMRPRPTPGEGFDPDRAAALLVAAVQALSDWPGRPSVVPITAGRDSRVVLAAALAAGIDFETTTGGEPGHPDVEIGRELARVAGVPWKPIEHDPHGSVTNDWRRAAELLWLTSSGTASLADAAGFPFGPRPGPLPLWHSGQGGEIARTYYGLGSDANELYDAFLAQRPGRRDVLNRDGRRLVREQLDLFVEEQLAAGIDRDDVADTFYLHRRMGTWAGPTHGAVEYVRDTTSPLWSRRLLPDLLGLPRRTRARAEFHRAMLERLAPQLLEVPFEAPRTMRRKVADELRRRIRPRAVPGDPFARVLPEIRDAVLSQPRHPAWQVLDRPRVEELLASDAAFLDTMSRYYVWRLATVFGPTA